VENPLAHDLDHILARTLGLWDELRGQRLFITGGTGFFGHWLLESFAWANDKLELGSSVVVLTRNPHAFEHRSPHLASHPAIQLCSGDVRSFEFPTGRFSHVIHAGTDASAKLNEENPLLMFETIFLGTQRVLDFARCCDAQKVLYTSSGAVYGRQPHELSRVPEDYHGAPDSTDPHSAYAEGKRAAEMLGALHSRQHGLQLKIARCFAFVGPYLPLDAHFAIGNFIRDGLNGGPIRVNGDGTPYRSYLYAADLAIWLWTILFKGKSCRPYNAGSEQALTIAELAEIVSNRFEPKMPVEIAKEPISDKPAERYVPANARAREELKLAQTVELADAVSRTIRWHRRDNSQKA
jgi:nucleoside-diphosphate-sugar epimerase